MRITDQPAALAAALGAALLACTAAQADQQAFHRAHSGAGGDTTSGAEIAHAAVLGYAYEGVSGHLVSTGSDFYRSYSGSQGDHFYTKSVSEWFNATDLGYTLEGSAGKVF